MPKRERVTKETGRVSVPLPFDEAMKRVMQVKPPPEGFEQEAWRRGQKERDKGPEKRRKGKG